MAENILDYIAAIEENQSEDTCLTQSTQLTVEGSTNEFVSSTEDFLCWQKGDLFIVWGTDYNDGVYKKANGTNAYRLKAEAALPGMDPVSLTTEDLTGTLVAINEVSAIGQGSMVIGALRRPDSRESCLALIGQVGSGSASLELPVIDGRSGQQGHALLQPLEAEAHGGEHGSVEIPALTTDVTGSSGNKAIITTQAITVDGEASYSNEFGNASAELHPFWSSGTSGYVRESYWGSAIAELPSLIGGDFSDAVATLPSLTAQAWRYLAIEGKCYFQAVEVHGWSQGTTAHSRLPSPQVAASGASGAQGTVELPSLTAEVHRGAWGRNALPALTTYGKDDGWPDYVLGSGEAELPFLEMQARYDAPIFETATAAVSLKAFTAAATGLVHVVGSGQLTLRALTATGSLVQGGAGSGDITLEPITMGSDGATEYVGDAEIALSAISMLARIYTHETTYPLLVHQEEGDDYVWQ